MITDFETNKVYFSGLLESNKSHYKEAKAIFAMLDKFGVEYDFLPNTKDIWARDYMPIQLNEELFLEYQYDPDYLQNDDLDKRNTKTIPRFAFEKLNLNTKLTDLLIDGGNLIKSANTIILTDKVVTENNYWYAEKDLFDKLKNDFLVDNVILIPYEEFDIYGHADGMLRFIDHNTVLVDQNYKHDFKLIEVFEKNNLDYKFLELTNTDYHENSWAYINFLQTKDIILLPKINEYEDKQIFKQIEKLYPAYEDKITFVDCNYFLRMEGGLNCLSWTVKE